MDAWKDIVKTILIGSSTRAELPDSVLKEFQALGVPLPKGDVIESALLEATATYSLLRQAGLSIQEELKELPYKKSPNDTLERCSLKASTCLSQILQNNQDEVLVEWLQKMDRLQKRAPEELLPDLLSFGAMHERLREPLLKVLGERGRWLAQFNKRWSFAESASVKEDAEDQFHLGNLKERLNYIQQLRKNDATLALDLLESSWDTEDYQTKSEFIKVLEEDLSENDTHFLENALEDRRKEVRQEAANLLARLPSSSLVKRFENQLKELIQFDTDKQSLRVELPSKIDKYLKRDGIREHYKPLPEGKKANWLAQMIAMVPPTFWEKYWNLSAEECLEIATNDDYRNLWWWAWGTAAKRLNDEDWLLAMHRYIIDYKPSGKKSLHFSLDFLYNDLSNSLFNQLAWEYLEKDESSSIISDDHPAMLLLLQEHQHWNDQLAIEVIDRIRKAIANDAGVFNWNQKTLLKRAAFAINPSLYNKLENGWPDELGYSWQSEVHNFLANLRFRREIMNLEG